ncbi:hypothetical protein M758_1G250500 [Ceratodon purpureus]|nr:hypothetical protein M758_1G250500 [Ceratodon purpureus]
MTSMRFQRESDVASSATSFDFICLFFLGSSTSTFAAQASVIAVFCSRRAYHNSNKQSRAATADLVNGWYAFSH